MKARPRAARGLPPRGFTLVELLIVIAIIAVLAALLLPALARGKAAAQSAACKSNLRQLGLALNMYVNDYDKYPGNGAIYYGGLFIGIGGTGMNWLKPYLGVRYDPVNWLMSTNNIGISGEYIPQAPVFICPAETPPQPTPLGLPTPYYGYNELGTVWKESTDRPSQGLGYTVQGFDVDAFGLTGLRRYVKPGNIKNPSDLIAIADGDSWLSPLYPYTMLPAVHAGTLYLPHSHRANVTFCDGHVEVVTGEKLVEPTDSARKRWNNDNQPHPETW